MTRKVRLGHYGPLEFANDTPWGQWAVDFDSSQLWLEEKGRYIHENGYWLDGMQVFHKHDKGLEGAIVELIDKGDSVVDLGCGLGKYVTALNAAGVHAEGIDGSPFVEQIPKCRQADLTENGTVLELMAAPPDWTLCLEVGEHVTREKELPLVSAIASARKGAIVSWAIPDQPGQGHVNCRPQEEVIEMFRQLGMYLDRPAMIKLRSAAVLPWFRSGLFVFRQGAENAD